MSDLPRWLVIVMGQDEQLAHAALVIEPASMDAYSQLRRRMRSAGFNRITGHAYSTLTWPYAAHAAVDVVKGNLIRITTGQSSIYAGHADAPPFPLTARWIASARARRVLVGLVRPGALVDGDDVARQGALLDAVDGGLLLGASARARFDLPVSRPTA